MLVGSDSEDISPELPIFYDEPEESQLVDIKRRRPCISNLGPYKRAKTSGEHSQTVNTKLLLSSGDSQAATDEVLPGTVFERGNSNIEEVRSEADDFCETDSDSNASSPKEHTCTSNSGILTANTSTSANFPRLRWPSIPLLPFSVLPSDLNAKYYVCYFDQLGPRTYPYIGRRSNIEAFVRDIRSVTGLLDPRDTNLGFATTFLEQSQEDFHVIHPVGSEGLTLRTIVPPIWSSSSPFGRGALAWARYDEERDEIVGPQMVMMTNLWSEQPIPRYVFPIAENNPEFSVSDFVRSGDVYGGYPSYLDLSDAFNPETISMPVPLIQREAPHTTSILYRIIRRTAGRPLWEYVDEKELARAMIVVLYTHKTFCEMKILHREFKPENILLAENQPGREGFIVDFDFAHVDDVTRADSGAAEGGSHELLADREFKTRVPKEDDRKINAPTSGSLQFAALDLLMAIDSQRKLAPGVHVPFKHKARHDLESIVWVLGYIQLRRMLLIAAGDEYYDRAKEFLDTTFMSAFGRSKVPDILRQRELVSPLEWIEERSWMHLMEDHLSAKLGGVIETLFRKLRRLFYKKRGKNNYDLTRLREWDPYRAKYREREEELTHDYMINLFYQIQ